MPFLVPLHYNESYPYFGRKKGCFRLTDHLVLSETEKLILESYKTMMDGLSAYLGDCYELVLHSLEDLDHSVVKIINGHYTGRTEGAPITDLALTMLESLSQDKKLEVRPYFNQKNGGTLKSVTIPVVGERERIVGLLCINFHMELPFASFIAEFMARPSASENPQETFSSHSDGVIFSILSDVKAAVYSDSSVSSNNKNKEIIRRLSQKGIFKMKDSVANVAENLGISKNTVYLHLRNNEKDGH